ncbi:MAG: YbaK/EbsC family protein [Patescibacteria group bacterium]
MSVLDRILEILETNKISYKRLEHEYVRTSKEAASIRGVSESTGAKALILTGDCGDILCVLPGDQKLDLKKIKTHLNVKNLCLASPDNVKELTGLEVGSIPPFGVVLNLRTLYDRSLLEKELVAFNAGDHCVSIIMNPQDLAKLNKPEVLDIIKGN